MSRSRPQSAYFSLMPGGLGTSEFLMPPPTPEPSPSRVSASTPRGSASSQRRRAKHHSQSLSPASSLASSSPGRPSLARSVSTASSGSATSTMSTAYAKSIGSASASTLGKNTGSTSTGTYAKNVESPTRISKEERARRCASQPVLVKAYTSPKKPSKGSIYSSIVGSGRSNKFASGSGIFAPVQYPSATMFTVQSVLSSIGYTVPQLYELSLDFVEVTDAYFHSPGHLSHEIVLGGRS